MANNLPAIQAELQKDEIIKRVESRLGEKAGTFITSVMELAGDDKNLQDCDPQLVVKEALKSAGLDLPLNKNLGFAYVIPYKDKGKSIPQFQMGYKGYIQLAIRTAQYKHLNAGAVYEGEIVIDDRIKGTLKITGTSRSDKAVGYFAYMELVNGFEKAIFWTREKVEAHAQRFSKSYGKGFSPWKTDFDAMAKKTMILQLLPKYGPMTIEMSAALTADRGDFAGFNREADVQGEIDKGNASGETIDLKPEPATGPEPYPKTAKPAGSNTETLAEKLKKIGEHDPMVFSSVCQELKIDLEAGIDQKTFTKASKRFNALVDAENSEGGPSY